jgi:hypothetical protein
MMPSKDACGQNRILTKRYIAHRHAYIEKVRKLEGVDGAGFEVAYLRAERARIAFEESRVRRNEHIAQHGCEEQNSD